MARSLATLATFATLIAMSAANACGEEIHWLSSIDQARQIAGQTNRLVLVHFWANGCEPCVRLENQVYARVGTAERLEGRFVPVKVNASQFPAVAQQYGVNSWPMDVLLAPNGQVLATLRCAADQIQYLAGLERAAQNAGIGQVPAYAGLDVPATQPPPPAVVRPPAASYPPPRAPGAIEDRYADYYRSRQQLPPASPAPASPPAPAAAQASWIIPSMSGPPSDPAAPRYAQPGMPPAAAPAPPRAAAPVPSRGNPPSGPNVSGGPAATAPLGLDGFCPVELVEREQWRPGDRRFGAVHRGRTYLFAGQEQQQRFLKNPDYYAPALSGFDPVMALESKQLVNGTRDYGVFVGKRVYLFANDGTKAQFCRDRDRFTQGVRTAEAGGGLLMR